MSSPKRTVVEAPDIVFAADEQVRAVGAVRSTLRLAVRSGAVIVLAVASYFVIRQGIAASYFSRNDPRDVELAARWDPQNPSYSDTLAHLSQFYSENPDPSRSVQLCETAVQLSPNDAHYWADLGSAYDRGGRSNDAMRAFETARRLFPNSPDITWRLANFYVRSKRATDALPLLKNVLMFGGVDDNQVFRLISGAGIDPAEIAANILPARGPLYVDYMNFELASGSPNAAGKVWSALIKSGLDFRPGDAFSYFDALIRDRQVDAAASVWRDLAGHFPSEMRARSSAGNLVTNGGFDIPILDGGFDWRVIPTAGATVRIATADKSHPTGVLRIDFDGSQNVDYGSVLQFIQVQPETQYEFSAEARADGITTDSGPRFQFYDQYDVQKLFVSTPNQVGTSAWSPVTLKFKTGSATRLVVLRIARPPSQKFDNKISGTFWVRHVSLSPGNERQTSVQ